MLFFSFFYKIFGVQKKFHDVSMCAKICKSKYFGQKSLFFPSPNYMNIVISFLFSDIKKNDENGGIGSQIF